MTVEEFLARKRGRELGISKSVERWLQEHPIPGQAAAVRERIQEVRRARKHAYIEDVGPQFTMAKPRGVS